LQVNKNNKTKTRDISAQRFLEMLGGPVTDALWQDLALLQEKYPSHYFFTSDFFDVVYSTSGSSWEQFKAAVCMADGLKDVVEDDLRNIPNIPPAVVSSLESLSLDQKLFAPAVEEVKAGQKEHDDKLETLAKSMKTCFLEMGGILDVLATKMDEQKKEIKQLKGIIRKFAITPMNTTTAANPIPFSTVHEDADFPPNPSTNPEASQFPFDTVNEEHTTFSPAPSSPPPQTQRQTPPAPPADSHRPTPTPCHVNFIRIGMPHTKKNK
jgi:hypothetical protein